MSPDPLLRPHLQERVWWHPADSSGFPTMHTTSYEFLMKPKESAGCHQILSSWVGSGDETTLFVEVRVCWWFVGLKLRPCVRGKREMGTRSFGLMCMYSFIFSFHHAYVSQLVDTVLQVGWCSCFYGYIPRQRGSLFSYTTWEWEYMFRFPSWEKKKRTNLVGYLLLFPSPFSLFSSPLLSSPLFSFRCRRRAHCGVSDTFLRTEIFFWPLVGVVASICGNSESHDSHMTIS